MSFSPSNTTKTAENNLSGLASGIVNQRIPMLDTQGTGALNTGAGNVNAGTNFFNSLLHGNAQSTLATLQPSLEAIRQAHANRVQAINTLMPRGGGRSAALFSDAYAPQSEISNLFSQGRTTGATALPQIGLAQQGIGTNLFGLGNQALGTAAGANTNLAGLAQQDRATSLAIASALGQSLFKLATTPFGGGSASQGLAGLI